MDSSPRRRPTRDLGGGGDGLEEGEYVPGGRDESSDTDGDGGVWYRLQRLEGQLGRGVSWMEVATASSGRRALVARSSCESDGTTISDDDSSSDHPSAADSSAAVSISAGAPARRFACRVCGRGLGSPKAVDGHMRVHGTGRMAGAAVVVGGGWAATGKRGWTGGRPSVAAVCLNSESTDDHSTAVVVAQPIPMAIAVTSSPSSTRTNLPGEESSSSATAQPMVREAPAVATVVTGPNNPSTGAVVHDQQAAPIPAAEQARPVHQPAVPPPQAHPVFQPAVPLPTASLAQPRRVYSCKLCGKSYPSQQGLGGHAAGHKYRQREAEAAAAAAAGVMMGLDQDGAALRRGRRAEQPHECRKCHKVFDTGVALGGHMRMHYNGPPIVHKRRCPAPPPAPAVSEADLRLALSTVTEERRPSPPSAVTAGRVRLFGIDIGPQVQAPPSKEEEQGSCTAEGSSSSEGEKQ